MTAAARVALTIIGASAAGLAAALSGARAGADVTLLEARDEIGVPPAPAIVGFDHLWPREIEPPARCVRRRLPGARLRSPEGRGPLLDAPLALFDRARLDQWLADEAQAAGARIVTGVRGLDVTPARATWSGGERRTDVLLFADGARTQARRFLAPTRDPDALAWGAVLDVDAPTDADRLALTFGSHAAGARSQLNPLGEGRWSHWTFFRGDPARAETIARRALALDARLQGWSDPKATFAGVAVDPVYTIPHQLAKGRVMVAGGAAGQGGLEMGLTAGWMAGEAAARGRPEAYARAWKARYQKGYHRLRAATDALARLDDRELDRLFGAWDGVPLPPAPRARLLLAHPRGALALAHAAWLAQARG